MDVPYRIDHATQTAVRVNGGPKCPVCRSADRPAIEAARLKGFTFAEIGRQYDLEQRTVARHFRLNHLQSQIVQKVDRAARTEMNVIYDKLQRITDRMLLKAESDETPVQYAPQYGRTSIVGLQTQVDIHLQAEKLRLEREKLDQSRQFNTAEYRVLVADYFRKHHPVACECCGESIDRFLGETDEHD